MKQRDIQVRAVLRDPPDIELLAKALVQLAIEQQQERDRLNAKARAKKPASGYKASSSSPNEIDLVK